MSETMDQATRTMIENLQAKTGRTLDEWVALVRARGEAKHGEMLKFLKSEQGLTHGYANLIALTARGQFGAEAPAADELTEAQYSGDKAVWRPVYDSLVGCIQGFGSDVELAPKKAYVSLRRAKQFGLIQPSTKARLDLGLCLKGVEPSGRLEAAGSWNGMVSHRIRITAADQVDDEVLAWLRQAYDQAG